MNYFDLINIHKEDCSAGESLPEGRILVTRRSGLHFWSNETKFGLALNLGRSQTWFSSLICILHTQALDPTPSMTKGQKLLIIPHRLAARAFLKPNSGSRHKYASMSCTITVRRRESRNKSQVGQSSLSPREEEEDGQWMRMVPVKYHISERRSIFSPKQRTDR